MGFLAKDWVNELLCPFCGGSNMMQMYGNFPGISPLTVYEFWVGDRCHNSRPLFGEISWFRGILPMACTEKQHQSSSRFQHLAYRSSLCDRVLGTLCGQQKRPHANSTLILGSEMKRNQKSLLLC